MADRLLALALVVALFGVLAPVAGAQPRRAALVACPPAERALLHRLIAINANLDVGTNFTKYKALVVAAKVAYDEAPVSSETRDCIHYVGVPDEKALNDYVHALNSWSDCIASTKISCQQGPGENFRQRQWSDASAQIKRASNALGA